MCILLLLLSFLFLMGGGESVLVDSETKTNFHEFLILNSQWMSLGIKMKWNTDCRGRMRRETQWLVTWAMWRGTKAGSEGRVATVGAVARGEVIEMLTLGKSVRWPIWVGEVGHCITVMSECPNGKQVTDLVTCRILRERRGGVAGKIQGQVTKMVQTLL